MQTNSYLHHIKDVAFKCTRRRKRRTHFLEDLQFDGGQQVEQRNCCCGCCINLGSASEDCCVKMGKNHAALSCCIQLGPSCNSCCSSTAHGCESILKSMFFCCPDNFGTSEKIEKGQHTQNLPPSSSNDSDHPLKNPGSSTDIEKNGVQSLNNGQNQEYEVKTKNGRASKLSEQQQVDSRKSEAISQGQNQSEVTLQDVQIQTTEKRIQELGIQIDADNKEELQKIKCNLISLIVVINEMKKKLVKAKGQHVILAVGSTGCGKSTMLNSLIWGPDSLEAKRIQQTIELKGGKTKQLTRMVIESKNPQKDFKIGHSSSKSETFLPHFYKMDKIKSMFVDLAGLEDTSGQFISLVNCFISKFIFDYASTVRFLVPLTKEATENARGSQIKDLLRTVQHICSKELDDIVSAMQPVITRVKPDDDETDIYELRQTVSNQLETELQAWINLHMNSNEDSQLIDQQRKLYENFTDKMELYDPLDRPLPNQDDPQSITTKELLERITQLTAIEGSHLNAPIPTKSMSLLEQMFRYDFEACDELADKYIQNAKEEGKEFSNEFREEQIVQNFQLVLDFFAENALLSDSRKKQQEFRDYIYGDSGIMELIRDAKEFTGYNKASQEIFLYMQGVFKNRRKHEELVKSMMKLQDCIRDKKEGEKLPDIEAQSALDHMLSKASRQLEQVVIDLNQDPQKLMSFCYFLRKLDTKNEYTYDFLNGLVRPAILVDIICANKWDSIHEQMKYDVKTEFMIHIGNENKALEYKEQGGLPSICSEVGDDTVVWFKLEQGGLVITNGTHCLASQDIEIAQGSQCLAEFKTNPSQTGKQGSNKDFLWNLVQSSDRNDYQDFPYFHIEMTYGDVKPRLLYQKSSVFNSKILVSTRSQLKEYAHTESSVWKIFKV